ncbi:MAG: TetR/AcrR family transcriptional regulator [Actinomycetes bacterium]
MATTSSLPRVEMRRTAVTEALLDHAVDVMTESGVGALSISEVARRGGMRGPSVYKYFPSLHAVYDALFARGLRLMVEALDDALAREPAGIGRVRAGAVAVVRWCTENPALAQLMFWRVVPGFAPSDDVFAASVASMQRLRDELAAAVRLGELDDDAVTDDALRLFTVLLSGLISQQLANEPGVPFDRGAFTRLTESALDLFFTRYARRQ